MPVTKFEVISVLEQCKYKVKKALGTRHVPLSDFEEPAIFLPTFPATATAFLKQASFC